MISSENKNLITIYAVTLGVAVVLVVVIVNFNKWFFPNSQTINTSSYTPASRGMISDKDLRFGVLSDKKFIGLKPILTPSQLAEGTPVNPSGGTITSTVTPTTSPSFGLRHASPFDPF